LISITTSPRGKSRATEFSQVNEYMFVVYVGQARMTVPKGTGDEAEVRWRYLRRNDIDSARGTVKGGPQQFYPIYVDNSSGKIVKIGEALSPEDSVDNVPSIKGATPVFPIREDGEDMNWGLTGPSLAKALSNGYVRVTPGVNANQPYTFAYLTAPNIKKVETNELLVTGLRKDGSKIVVVRGGKVDRPTTVWRDTRYDAGAYGTAMLGDLIPGRKFPFPKSLYAVEDALRFFVNDKPHALVLDFFAGSGTTSHAVMRLNKQDGGRRQCILVTNNEVSADEAVALHAKGHESGDPEWEALGICEYITKPRLKAAITGLTPDGEQVDGTYRSPDQFPMSDGFEQNAEFFELTYEDVELVRLNMKFHAIAPFLWMKVGSQGRRIDEPTGTFDISDTYAVLFNVDAALDFLKASTKASTLRTAFIITDDEKQFQMIADELPHRVEAVRLYDSYISTLRVNVDRG
jgi:adenine-specific DNA-methyltransferase